MKNSVFATILMLLCAEATLCDAVHYDTAWTFYYDGGKYSDSTPIGDGFECISTLPGGGFVCLGSSSDTSGQGGILFVKLSSSGVLTHKKLIYGKSNSQYNGNSLCLLEDNDILIGGKRAAGPWILRTDSLGEIKWATWYYDSTGRKSLLNGRGNVNSILKTSYGTIVCALGDGFPDNDGYELDNYAAFIEFDSTGKLLRGNEWDNVTGYKIGGFHIEETNTGRYLLSGNQTVLYLDTNGVEIWKKKYTMMLDGVGSMDNDVSKAKMLRNGSLMAIGRAYEGNCWTNYNELHKDAWWSPISYSYGTNDTWDTAGAQRGTDGLYDFVQLVNGNIAFIGNKATTSDSGLWVFVTDSTGKQILWEKQYDLPGVDEGGYRLKNVLPESVCATPDSGFTVVGVNNTYKNNYNAFAMHFVPKLPTKISKKPDQITNTSAKVKCSIINERAVFSPPSSNDRINSLQVFNASGKKVAQINQSRAASNSIAWDCSGVSRGVYFYKLSFSDCLLSGKFVVR